MEVITTPNTARGEVAVLVGGQVLGLRFSLAVLHDYTTTTGRKLTDIGEDISNDLLGAFGNLLAAAVRRASGQPFNLGDALDLMEDMQQVESDAVAAAIWAAIKVEENPLLKALIAQAPKPSAPTTETSGASTSTLPSVS